VRPAGGPSPVDSIARPSGGVTGAAVPSRGHARSPGWIQPPSAKITARLIAFSTWRTLPGPAAARMPDPSKPAEYLAGFAIKRA